MMLRRVLADAAGKERDRLEARIEKLKRERKPVPETASNMLAHWRALVEIFERGETMRDISWGELHLTTSLSLISLSQRVDRDAAAIAAMRDGPEAHAAADKLRALEERRDLVAAVHDRVEHRKFCLDDTSSLLRDRPARTQAAA